jgi:hypothetical protein
MNKSNIKSNFKSKSIINKKKYNDTSSNDTSLLLTDREAHKYNKAKNMKSVGKIKDDKLNKDIKSINKYIKQNKYNDENNFKGLCCGNTRRNTNRNKLLSLNNQYGDSELNIIVSDFPFSNKSLILNDNKENQNLSNIHNSNNNISEININRNELHDNALEDKNFNKSYILSNTYEINHMENINDEKDLLSKKIKNKVLNDNSSNLNNSNDFIKKLRKMNHSKEKGKELSRKKSFLVYPSDIDVISKTISLKDKDEPMKNNFKIDNNIEYLIEESSSDNNLKKIENKNLYCEDIKVNNILENINHKVIKSFNTDVKNEINNLYLDNNTDKENKKNLNYNKYLKNQNYKNNNIGSYSIDSSCKIINNLNYNDNNNTNSSLYIKDIENQNKDNYDIANTDRCCCKFSDSTKKI